MNSLNSVLLEGNLTSDPDVISSTGCSFEIKSYRSYRNNDDEKVQETLISEIEAHGKLAETCLADFKAGDGVRIVGSLKQYPETKAIVILAEHVGNI